MPYQTSQSTAKKLPNASPSPSPVPSPPSISPLSLLPPLLIVVENEDVSFRGSKKNRGQEFLAANLPRMAEFRPVFKPRLSAEATINPLVNETGIRTGKEKG